MVQEQAAAAGAEFAMAAARSIARAGEGWIVASEEGEHRCRAVIVATGTAFRALGVPGEDALRGHGVSQCASCDAPLMRKQKVVVAGGGDSALQEALTLAVHVELVTLVHHGDAPIAQAAFRAQVEGNPKIELCPNTEITAILGDAAVTGARLRDMRTGALSEIEAVGVFVFVGLDPSSAIVADLLSLDERGHIVCDPTLHTSARGILTAGTVRAGAAGRATAAAGDGALAALAADAYLRAG
jgi:thioredoxin reductase (NADPH)